MKWDRQLIQTLDHLAVLVKRMSAGRMGGNRVGNRSGSTVEFLEHAPYTPGDDIRYVDWSVAARREQLFVKKFAGEQHVHISIILDISSSMGMGDPSKLESAKMLAASLCYLGLGRFDTISLYTFHDTFQVLHDHVRGKSRMYELLETIGSLQPRGKSSFDSIPLHEFRSHRSGGVVFLISDLWDAHGWKVLSERLPNLRARMNLIQVLSLAEIDPQYEGSLRLIDVETDEGVDMVLDRKMLDRYRKEIRTKLHDIERFCMNREWGYLRTLSHNPIEVSIIEAVRRGLLEHVS